MFRSSWLFDMKKEPRRTPLSFRLSCCYLTCKPCARGLTPHICTKVARFGLPLAILRVLVVNIRSSTALPKD